MYFHKLREFVEMLLGIASNLEKSLGEQQNKKERANEGAKSTDLPKGKI